MPTLPELSSNNLVQIEDAVRNWLIWLWYQPYGRSIMIVTPIMILLLVSLVMHIVEQPGVLKAPRLPKTRTTRRWPWTKTGIPFRLGKVIIDLQPRRGDAIHLAIGGTSGTGKTSSVLSLLDLPIGVLVIALDNTRPLAIRVRELADGIEWTNEPSCRTPWNMLAGPPELVAESLVAGWPRSMGDSGHYRRIARMRMWDRLEQADRENDPRSLAMLIESLMRPNGSGDGQVTKACRDWATKLLGMAKILGPSIGGPGDLDLVQAMHDKKKVLMRLNRFLNPDDAPTLGGMLLVHARRVAQECTEPFVLIVEEAGLLESHQEHISPLAQASRDRDVSLIVITQNLSMLPLEVRNNVSCWVSFAQEDDKEIQFAARKLRLRPTQLWRESFRDEGRRWAWVRGPGIPTQLAHIQQFKPVVSKPRKLELQPEPVISTANTVYQKSVDGWQPYPLALPATRKDNGRKERSEKPYWVGIDPDMNRFWRQMRRSGQPVPLWNPERGVWWDESGCLLWMGPLSKPKNDEKLGRPRSNRGKASVTVYCETAAAAGKTFEPTWDHDCDTPVCVDPEHGHGCTNKENNNNRHLRESMLESAWMSRCGYIPTWWQNRHHERA